MIDPRPTVFAKRLAPVRRIIAVGGGKGGVGKTTVTCLTALSAARAGRGVGVLDLDIHGGAAHVLLGIAPVFPDEKGGILPLIGSYGLHFMSATAFSGDRPLALRGAEVTDAIAELLAVTIWPALDLLIVDLPPGLGESHLDLLRFMPRAEIVAVTTPSELSVQVADRFLSAVRSQADLIGVVANMVPSPALGPNPSAGRTITELAARHSVPVVATVPSDSALESATGRPDLLLETAAASSLSDFSAKLASLDSCSPTQ